MFIVTIFLIGGAALLACFSAVFVVHPFFDFEKHEVAVDGPHALDEKFGVQNFG